MATRTAPTTAADITFTNGALELFPTDEQLDVYFGRRNMDAWRSLQAEAEKSYAVREVGHFSVDSYAPAKEYGAMLAGLTPGDFLDVGCGKLARPAYMLPDTGIRFFGVDPMRIESKRDFPHVRALGDFLPFQAETFDCVFFASSLDHAINPRKALEDAKRILKPGGTLSLWVTIRPEDRALQSWATRSTFFQSRYNALHNWAFTRVTVETLLSDLGFSNFDWRKTSDPNEDAVFTTR